MKVHRVPADGGTNDTVQTSGMARTATICKTTVGAEMIWMGRTVMAPQAVSGAHHHGDNETAIFVVSGTPEFIYWEGEREVHVPTTSGDFVFIPPHVPHIESNAHSDQEAVVVISRSSQQGIVQNVERP
jgi:uncharacterized RmlC-like cupin family protein